MSIHNESCDTQVRRLLVDTDAGTDDLLAISYLLMQPDIEIIAVTVVDGIAHVAAGAKNVRATKARRTRGNSCA